MTRVNVDEDLITRAQGAAGALTPEQVVATALEEFIRQREQPRIVELFGTISYEPDYDYKQQRNRS